LTLCCNLAGYRGAGAEAEVVADLNQEEFAPAYQRLRRIADEQVERRRQALAAHSQAGTTPDLYTGSPCLYCLQSYHKIPWRRPTTGDGSRSLPVLTSATAGKGSTFN
ncbi:MAG: hypothetical protein ACRD9R_05870, partial [Pyrinomonadaceae bacterium]